MIIKPRARRPGGLARHLTNAENNEAIEFSAELSRTIGDDIHQGLRELVAMAGAFPRVERCLLHFIVSPGKPAGQDQLGQVLDLVELMHDIPPSTPRVVVLHTKGDRAVHAHAVYLGIDLNTGLGFKSHNSFHRAEAAQRAAEDLLGEPLVSSPNNRYAAEILKAKGFDALADRVQALPPPRRNARLDQLTKDVLVRGKTDSDALAGDLWSGFQACKHDPGRRNLAAHLAERGIEVSLGRKALLVNRKGTTASIPLLRTLKRIAAAKGNNEVLRKATIDDLMGRKSGPAVERHLSSPERHQKAKKALHDEYTKLAIEAALDGDRALAAKVREHEQRLAQRNEFTQRLRTERQAINYYYRRIAIVRRMRVDRAFRAAKWWAAHRRLRKFAILAAGTAVLLAGGGLGLALVAGGLAFASIPSFERARAAALAAQREALRARRNQQAALQDAFHRIRDELRQSSGLKTATTSRIAKRPARKTTSISSIARPLRQKPGRTPTKRERQLNRPIALLRTRPFNPIRDIERD